jgi:hypothetical protein
MAQDSFKPDSFEADSFEPDSFEADVPSPSLWQKLNEPLTNLPSRLLKPLAESLYGYSEAEGSNFPKAAQVGGAFTESLGGVLDSLTSPISAGLAALTGGSALAARTGVARLIPTFTRAQQVAGAGMAAHGGYQTIMGETPEEKIAGALEAIGGGLGMKFPYKPKLPKLAELVDELPPELVRAQPKLLNPASGSTVQPSGPGFIAGEAGTAIDVPYRVSDELGNVKLLDPDLVARGETGFGTPASPKGTIANLAEPAIPSVSGDTRLGFSAQSGAELPYPLNVVPNSVRPRVAQTEIASRTGLPLLRETTEDVGSELSFISGGREVTELPPSQLKYEPLFRATQSETTTPIAQVAAKLAEVSEEAAPIVPTIEPKRAVLNWTRGLDAAKWRGVIAAQKFDDLTDPTLVDKYQQGFRQGKLTEVQQAFDDLFEAERKLGLIDDDKYRENYLRQFWDYTKSDPEAVKVFENKVISKQGAFTKDRTFESYAQGRAAGMVPKFETIPEIYGARVAESYRALKNKELYDYLNQNGWIKPTKAIHAPEAWEVTGPHSKEIRSYLKNYLEKSSGITKALGDFGSFTKNIYLSGGIPKTKYNMHLFNTARADIKLMGFGRGLKEAITDPTGNKAIEWFNKTDKRLLPELVEHGYQFSPVQDFMAMKEPTGGVISRAVHSVADVFESPLFKRALPVLKFKRAQQIFNKLEPKMGREAALDAAAQISNQFYGGIEKSLAASQIATTKSSSKIVQTANKFVQNTVESLRGKQGQDLVKFALIAPDWAEAKMRQALSEWKATGKVLMGRGDPVDQMLAKSFGRGILFPAAGAATTAALGHELVGDTPRFTLPISLGDKATFPTLTTADESIRIPLAVVSEMGKGNLLSALTVPLGGRISPALRTPYNLLQNRNYWGGRLSNESMSTGESIGNILGEASRPIQQQVVTAMIKYLMGDLTAEEATAQGLELPIAFRRDD